MTPVRAALVLSALFLVFSHSAKAAMPTYTVVGGTPAEQAQIGKALAASSFDWSVIGHPITVYIDGSGASDATPGDVYLDASLLDSGSFSWGTIQHEFGHQVDFFALTDQDRAQLQQAFGVGMWFGDESTAAHSAFGCERFASELSWAFWQSGSNSMGPSFIGSESSSVPTAQFRTVVAQLLGMKLASASKAQKHV